MNASVQRKGTSANKTGRGRPDDWSSQQMLVLSEETRVLLRGLNTMRQIQDQAVRAAAGRHAAAGKGLWSMQPGGDALAWHAEMLRQDIDGAVQCMQQLTAAALETGAELVACATHLINTEDAFETTTRLVHA